MDRGRPRVVFLDHVARWSGGEISLARLLPALADQVDPLVILGEDGPLRERLELAGIDVEVLSMPVAARDVRKDRTAVLRGNAAGGVAAAGYVRAVQRRLRQLRPDLVHTNSLKAAMYGGVAGRLVDVPVVWHIRDRIAPDYLPHPTVAAVRALSRALPAAVIANSQSTLATLPWPRIPAVVANCVDPPSGLRVLVRPEVRRVGIVGRLAEWKGQHVFLDAFAAAFPNGDVEAWIVGDALFGETGYADELHARARRLGIADRAHFRGHRDDVWAELAELDVLVHASITPEPFGQVVIEGMAMGLPVVASRAGGPVEIITPGEDGILVTPGDVGELSAALRRLAADSGLRAGLGAAARQVAAGYTPERTAAQVVSVYERVLSRG